MLMCFRAETISQWVIWSILSTEAIFSLFVYFNKVKTVTNSHFTWDIKGIKKLIRTTWAVMQTKYWTVIAKNYPSVYFPALTYGVQLQLWVVTERIGLRMQRPEWVSSEGWLCSALEIGCSLNIQREFEVEPQRLRFKRSQSMLFSHLIVACST